jgi:hypothetical protein
MKTLLLIVVTLVGSAIAGVGGVLLGGFLFAGCGGGQQKPIVAPNRDGANCLIERQMLQLTCAQHYETRAAIDKCLAEAKLPDCTTEAGVAAFITSRDAGGDR